MNNLVKLINFLEVYICGTIYLRCKERAIDWTVYWFQVSQKKVEYRIYWILQTDDYTEYIKKPWQNGTLCYTRKKDWRKIMYFPRTAATRAARLSFHNLSRGTIYRFPLSARRCHVWFSFYYSPWKLSSPSVRFFPVNLRYRAVSERGTGVEAWKVTVGRRNSRANGNERRCSEWRKIERVESSRRGPLTVTNIGVMTFSGTISRRFAGIKPLFYFYPRHWLTKNPRSVCSPYEPTIPTQISAISRTRNSCHFLASGPLPRCATSRTNLWGSRWDPPLPLCYVRFSPYRQPPSVLHELPKFRAPRFSSLTSVRPEIS